MSERPTFWIHRTRLFWLGLGVLILLTGGILVICYRSMSVSHWHSVAATHLRSLEVGLRRGGVYAVHADTKGVWVTPRTPHGSRWHFSTREHPGFELWPEVETAQSRRQVFIPLWPFLVLWCFLWPWWMHYSERKMVERYRKKGG